MKMIFLRSWIQRRNLRCGIFPNCRSTWSAKSTPSLGSGFFAGSIHREVGEGTARCPIEKLRSVQLEGKTTKYVPPHTVNARGPRIR